MKLEIKVPSVGESVQEAILAQWFKHDGEAVKKDEPLFVIETDKVTLEIVAEADGILKIQVPEGETVAIGAVVGTLDTAAAPMPAEPPAPEAVETPAAGEPSPSAVSEVPVAEKEPPRPDAKPAEPRPAEIQPPPTQAPPPEMSLAPSVRRLAAEKQLDLSQISGTGPGGRLTKGDLLLYLEQGPKAASDASAVVRGEQAAAATTPAVVPELLPAAEAVKRRAMSPIRQRIAARLLAAKQNTAMLTTFNEIDMSGVQAIRARYKEMFKTRYGINLGYMSFFSKACIEALKEFPELNAFIDGSDIVYPQYYHLGIAVSGKRGLVVPVVRHADRLGFAALEQAIVEHVQNIRDNRLALADLEGGTFTITNGGVFGSLLSTPILNLPQSGILGMHKIEDRPVALGGEVVIRPMMYVALSYDHRIVDGREAVTFLLRVKECIENPERIMLEI